MAGPNIAYHVPIASVKTTTGLTPYNESKPEKAGQTFKIGVPVQLSAGFVQQWDGATILNGIAGFSETMGQNLSSNGRGAPGPFGQITGNGAIQTWGNVANTPLGVNIASGTPMADGRTLFEAAVDQTIFEGQFDNSAGNVAADFTPTQAMMGANFGLTADASGQFYVDGGKVTDGTNTVVRIIGVNPIDGFVVNARVRFQVLPAAQQLALG